MAETRVSDLTAPSLAILSALTSLGHHTVLYLSERRGDLQGKAEFAETQGTMGVVEGEWRVEEKERQRVVEKATGNERAFIPGRGSEWQTRQVRTPDQTRRAVR